MVQPTSDKLQLEQETINLTHDTLIFLQERIRRASSISTELLECRRTAELDLSCIPMALSSKAVVSDSYCLSEKRKWLLNLSTVHHMLSKLSQYIENRRSNLDNEIRSRSMRESFEKLPNEIISPIFINASRSFVSYHDRIQCSLRISQVSRRFRNIALHTPELWSIISTSFPSSMVSTFIKRSRTHNLDVRVVNIKTTKMLTNFPAMVIPTRKRWTTLDCSVYAGIDLVGCLTQGAQTSFPRLQELRIEGKKGLLLDQGLFWEAPNLRVLTIVNADFNFMSSDIGSSSLTIPSYIYLQDVHLEKCGGSTWPSLFQAMQSRLLPAVSSVRISDVRWEQIPATYSLPGQQNIIAQLNHLVVDEIQNIINNKDVPDGYSYWRTLMSFFYFPNLYTINLSAYESGRAPDHMLSAALRELEPDRIPNLHSLLFRSCYNTYNFDLIGQYLEPLSGFTSLRHVTIQGVTIRSLASDPPRNAVLPPLATITIRNAKVHSIESFFKLAKMLRDSPHWNSFEMFRVDSCIVDEDIKRVDGWIGELNTLLEGKITFKNWDNVWAWLSRSG